MARITLTAAAQTALASPKPTFLRRLFLYKNLLDSSTRVEREATEWVTQWGRLVLPSSAEKVNMEKPNLAVTVQNVDNFFNIEDVNSWWRQSPAKDFTECTLLVQVFVRLADGSFEKCRQYYGRIDDCVLRFDENMSVAELVTVMEQDAGMRHDLTKTSRMRTLHLPYGVLVPPGAP